MRNPEEFPIESGKPRGDAEEVSPPEETPEEPVEEEPQLSVADLKRYTEELKARAEAVKAQREKDIEQKISDRESLIARAKENDELLREAQESLDYFTAMQELGELRDPADVKRLTEIKNLVDSLEKQRLEIDKKVSIISGRPEVLEKLQETAKGEDIERTVQSLTEQTHKELNPQIDQLAKNIRILSQRIISLWSALEKEKGVASLNRKKLVEDALERSHILSEKSELRSSLLTILQECYTAEELKRRLTEIRQSLGMFKGREKAVIDFILCKRELEEWEKNIASVFSLEQEFKKAEEEETASLAEQYGTIILKAWEAQDKINKLTGEPGSNDLPWNFSRLLEGQIDRFAGLKHWKEGKQVGKYDSWHEAISKNPENSTLYHTWKAVAKPAGKDLGWSRPKEEEQE